MEQIIKSKALNLKRGRCEQRYFTYGSREIKEELAKTSCEKSAKTIVIYLALIVIIFSHSIPINLYAEESKTKRCKGDFINPITDICWECLFPITIGSIELKGSDKPDTKNPSSPVCVCTKNGFPVGSVASVEKYKNL